MTYFNTEKTICNNSQQDPWRWQVSHFNEFLYCSQPRMNLFSNPWKVSNLEEFLYYCCPECIFRCKRIEEFEQHAIIAHLVEIHGQSDGNPPIIKLKNDLDEDPLKEENLNEVVKDEDKTVVKKESHDAYH